MKNSSIVIYTLLFSIFIHAQARAEEHDSQEIAKIVAELVGDMVSIPGGTFRMGDLSGDDNYNEKPVRSVMVPAFKMGKYEVTFAQWGACVVDGGCEYTSYGDILIIPAPDSPVVNVLPSDVQDFIDWLNSKTGSNFRLPSEAEWEYAARAGSTTKYSWGDDIGHNQANCRNCGSWWGDRWLMAPVGSFPANAWGLHDMHGNVWEWVQDCWHDSYEGAPTDGSAWGHWGQANCNGLTIRGGSWENGPSSLRSARRDTFTEALISIGFRLAQSAPAVPSQVSATSQPQIRTDALHDAAVLGDIETLKAAVTAGADVNTRDSRGWTALMYAADNGYVLLVSQLLEAQADMDMRGPDGATALFMAADDGRTEIIELLMKAGADISIRGLRSTTPVEVARERYGNANAARRNGEPPAVLALLEGKTWAKVEQELEEARAQIEPTVRQLVEEMVSIPAAEFRMGSRGRDADDDEKPAHGASVPAFKLGKHEVTVGQFRGFVVETGYLTDAERDGDYGCYGRQSDGRWGWASEHSWRDPGYGVADAQPVVCVSWEDVQSFISWLNDSTGGNFRLPSEAEWEYAARAGSTTKYSWGDYIGKNRANCYNCGSQWDNKQTAPVGSFPANAWGLHDMHGNVFEWVQDCWNDSYDGAPTDGSAWMSGDCGRRVRRGGSWDGSAGALRSADRYGLDRSTRGDSVGFRLAQDE